MRESRKALFFLDYDDGQGGRFVNSPGLLPLLGYSRSLGIDIEFVTEQSTLLETAQRPGVKAVGISSMERLLPRSIDTARRLRSLRPDLVLMLGGNALEPFAAELAAKLFDIVVLGEAEHVLPALLRELLFEARPIDAALPLVSGEAKAVAAAEPGGALDAGSLARLMTASFVRTSPVGKQHRVRVGRVYLRDSARGSVWFLEEPRSAPLSPGARGLDLGSAPTAGELDAMCIVPWDDMTYGGWKHFEFYTQRGCRWGRCEFCSVADREIRALSPSKVAEIIAQAIEHGIETISFADDLFVQHPAWNLELFALLEAKGLKSQYRAQTMPTRTLWPLLESMSEIGFFKVAFGLETTDPMRVEAMKKSFQGRKYLDNALETICRTAESGILPVLYLIMTDPTTTLAQLASELRTTVQLVDAVYSRTGVVPRLSYSLMMLPVASTAVVTKHAHRVTEVEVGEGTMRLPSEFLFEPRVTRFLAHVAAETQSLPQRRENLAALPVYLDCVARAVEHEPREDGESIAMVLEATRTLWLDLSRRLDEDARRTALAMLGAAPPQHGTRLYYDYRRLGCYVPGIELMLGLLQGESRHAATA